MLPPRAAYPSRSNVEIVNKMSHQPRSEVRGMRDMCVSLAAFLGLDEANLEIWSNSWFNCSCTIRRTMLLLTPTQALFRDGLNGLNVQRNATVRRVCT